VGTSVRMWGLKSKALRCSGSSLRRKCAKSFRQAVQQ
jgi:hypothetical protein